MNLFVKMFISTVMVFLLSKFLTGVTVDSLSTSLLVAVAIAFLNTFLKPILIFLTIPVTVVTFGLFLLVINATIILISDHLINGFHVAGFWHALLFSLLLSISSSILNKIFIDKE